jgi:high-affinity nickel-transport protein
MMINLSNNKNPYIKYSDWLPYAAVVLAIHILGIVLLGTGVYKHPEMLGMGLISYVLGLRHAFDADHIAAIDNMVRKLIEQKKNPKGVGFFFSFGHSTVVILMGIATIFTVKWAQQRLPELQRVGSVIALTVSGTFLLIIGIVNLFIWINIYKTFISMRRGNSQGENLEEMLASSGIIARSIKFLFSIINKNWHIYLLGFTFGLGFDTASQIALLATSAGAVSEAIPWYAILSFPILFTAGMSLMDTADGFFMCTAYQWVFSTPLRKVYYNLTVTGLSVVAALFIGSAEVLQVIIPKLGIENSALHWLESLNFNTMGIMLTILFFVVWATSFGVWKFLGMGEMEEDNLRIKA